MDAARFEVEDGELDDEPSPTRAERPLRSVPSVIGEEEARHTLFDTVRVFGAPETTASDVFERFRGREPTFVERVDERTFDAVFKDDASAADAMLVLSRATDARTRPPDLPPGEWRALSGDVYVRFGNKSDKRPSGTRTLESRADEPSDDGPRNPWGDLCRSWGVNDSQEVFARNDADAANRNRRSVKDRIGAPNVDSRLGKRAGGEFDVATDDESSEGDERKTRPKLPRMRMRADDEEEKRARSAFAKRSRDDDPSAFRIVNKRPTETAIKSRLGRRRRSFDAESDDERAYEDDSFCNKNLASTVWSRLDLPNATIDDSASESEGSENDLRTILYKRNSAKKLVSASDDLRTRIIKKPSYNRSALRVEFNNELCSDS